MKNLKLPMMLQFFAEDNGSDAQDTQVTDTQGQQGQIVFDNQSDLDALVDKRISRALATAQEKWATDWQSKTQTMLEQEREKANMSTEERLKADIEQQKQELEQQRLELQKEKDEASLIKQLNADKLPSELVEVFRPLFGGEQKNIDDQYKAVSKVFRDAVQNAVNERMLSNSQNKPSGNGGTGTVTQSRAERFAKQANAKNKANGLDPWATKI
ncbi:hypothetical protein CIRMBP1257_00521 [Enterococcus cecorum]|nr:hypothetical protein CIRMBP1257_00521 [Enterococcus cecorum]